MTEDEELNPTSHGRIYRILHYEVGVQDPPSKRELSPGTLAEVEKDWHDFPNLPGEHLSWRGAGRGCWELITDSDGAVSVRRKGSLLRNSISEQPRSYLFRSQGQTYEWQRV